MSIEVVPEPLRRRYLDSFPAKADAFKAVLDRLSDGNQESIRELRDLAHKLAGSAGMYGFDELGQQAREIVHAVDAGDGSILLLGMTRDLVTRLTQMHADVG
ncbi:MAG: Hpt domain-containing protein [Xanthomonadales bacterium]|nr:hypothetical protein [Xanthomonadales bacterium]MCC6594066.1 Hpt domain-containing protein [Xanthomonadales bacterium]MCE7930896.1 hypothetical protein [Xanthomonadales bacterium PRO6]